MAKKKQKNNGLALSFETKNKDKEVLRYTPKKEDKKTTKVKTKEEIVKPTIKTSDIKNTTDTKPTINSFSRESKNEDNNFDIQDVRTQKIDNKFTKDESTIENKYDRVKKAADLYLKDETKNYNSTLKNFQDKRAKELKKETEDIKLLDNNNKLDFKNKKTSFANEDKQKMEKYNKSLNKVDNKLKKERKKVKDARNELRYAQYVNDEVKAQTEDVNAWDKTGGNVTRALKDLGSNLTMEDDGKYTDSEGNKYYLPSYNEAKQRVVSDSYKTGVGKFLGDAAYEGTKIGAAEALNALTFGVGGKALYWSDMAADNYKNVRNQGYKDGDALLNTVFKTGGQYAKQKLLGGFGGKLTGGNASKLESAISNKVFNKIGNATLAKATGSGASEFVDEFTDEYLENIVDLATLKKSKNPQDYLNAITSIDNFKDALYAGGIGAVTGGTLGSIGSSETKQAKQNLEYLNKYRNELVKAYENTSQNNQNINNTITSVDSASKKIFGNDFKNVYENTSELTNQRQNALNQLQYDEKLQSDLDTLNQRKDFIEQAYKNKQITPIEATAMMQGLMEAQQTLTNNYNTAETTNKLTRDEKIEKLNEIQKQSETLQNQFKEGTIPIDEFTQKQNDLSYQMELLNNVETESTLKTEQDFEKAFDEIQNSNLTDEQKLQAGEKLVQQSAELNKQQENAAENITQSNIQQKSTQTEPIKQEINFNDKKYTELRALSEAGLLSKESELYKDFENLDRQQKESKQRENDYKLYENKQSNEQVLKVNDDGTTEFVENKPKILDKTTKEKKSLFKKGKNVAKTVRQLFFDKGQAIYDAAKKTKRWSLYHKFDNIASSISEAQSQVENSQTNLRGKQYKNFVDKDGNKTSMSLEAIWKDAKKSKIPDKVLNEYLVHKLNLDRTSQGVEQFENITADESEAAIKQIEKKYGKNIKRVANNVWQYNKNQLERMVEGGLISQKTANEFMEKTPHYVRIQRDVNGTNSSLRVKNGKLEINNQIQKVKGSAADIKPIKDTMAQFTHQVTSSIRQNLFGQELAKSAGISPTGGISTEVESFGINPEIVSNDNGNYSLTIFNNGNAMVIPIDEDIYYALDTTKSAGEQKIDTLGTPLRKLSSIQRGLLTDKNPLFMATNFFKDIGDAPFNSKYGIAAFYKNYMSLFGGRTISKLTKNAERVTAADWLNLYESLGGNQSSYFNQGELSDKKTKASKFVNKALTPIEKGNEFIESMPRLTEFKTTIEKNGYTLNKNGDIVPNGEKATKSVEDVLSEALYNSAEITTNFKRGGKAAKTINRNGGIFFNASMQGFSKLTRNFSESFSNPKQAAKLLYKVGLYSIVPAMINDAMYDDDEDYKDLPDYVKDEYYLFKSGDGKWIRIPKGRIKSIFMAAARRTKEFAKGNKDAFKGYGQIFQNQIAPNNPLENNVLSPIKAVATNKAWSGNDIVSEYLSTLPNEEQYDAKTSEISKWLGKTFGVSPKKIDYLLDQYSGGIGDVLLPMNTKYAENKGGLDAIISPLTSKFTTDSVLNNKTVGDYYDMLDKLEKKANSINSTTLDKAKQKYTGDYSDIKTQLSTLYREQREIQNDDTLTDREKYELNREKQQEIIDLMKETISDINFSSDNGDGTANIGTKTYSNYIDDYGNKKVKEVSMVKLANAYNLGMNTSDYIKMDNEISKMKADKDSNGKSISGSKKRKVISYLQSSGYSYSEIKSILNSYGWKY